MNDTDRNKAVELLSQQPQEMLFALGELKTLISYLNHYIVALFRILSLYRMSENLMKKTFRLNAYDARLQSANRSNLDNQTRDGSKPTTTSGVNTDTKAEMKDASTNINASVRQRSQK